MSAHDVPSYLAGYVAGYWAGYDFAADEPYLAVEMEEIEGESGPADGGANAPTTAPGPELPRGATRHPSSGGAPPGGSSEPSAVSSLPAIHQPAAPSEGEGEGLLRLKLAGELERIHAHRGIVLGLRIAAAEMDRLDLPEAERAIAALLIMDWDTHEVLR